MEYLIRNFQKADLDSLISLCARHAAHEQCEYDVNKKILLKRALLSNKPCLYCWIVTVKDKAVGYATFTFDFSTWDAGHFLHMDCLYLDENYRIWYWRRYNTEDNRICQKRELRQCAMADAIL